MRLQAAGRHFIEWHFIKQQCIECTSHYLLAYVVSSLTNYKACVDFFLWNYAAPLYQDLIRFLVVS